MDEAWKRRAMRLKADIPALLLAMKHPDTPLAAKALAAAAVCYALSPVDLIPDFIPVLGYLDDLLLLPGLIALSVRLIPPGVLEQCRAESAGLGKTGKNRLFAIPVVLIWAAVLCLLLRIFKK